MKCPICGVVWRGRYCGEHGLMEAIEGPPSEELLKIGNAIVEADGVPVEQGPPPQITLSPVEQIPKEAIGHALPIRVSDEDILKAGGWENPWNAEVENATAIVRRRCEAAGREIESITVTKPFRGFGIIEGCDFRGIEGVVKAHFKKQEA